ncbi:PilZ domain-containing protein [Halobacillus rhizosphaerae]|uniref:PilZ domain-containing protein n=1 Tax=Halobacillus rhizosphaerae TaxID=3064889 RepID=UPI00398AB821
MRYRRHESLRYVFKDPIPAHFKIIKVDNTPVNTSEGPGTIMDMSPGGLKLSANFRIPLRSKIQLSIRTTIANIQLQFAADLLWAKENPDSYHYGVGFINDHHEEVVEVLKKFRKSTPEERE